MISTITTAALNVENGMYYTLIIVIPLIVLLTLKEIYKAEIDNNERIRALVIGVNILIVPLLIIFIIIIAYKILVIVH